MLEPQWSKGECHTCVSGKKVPLEGQIQHWRRVLVHSVSNSRSCKNKTEIVLKRDLKKKIALFSASCKAFL